MRGEITELLRVLRGTFVVHQSYSMWLVGGVFNLDFRDPDPGFDRNRQDLQLVSLVPKLIARDARIGAICCQALDTLRQSFARVSTSNQTFHLKIVYCWLAQVPEAYVVLISENEPEALVTLAHHCVILHQVRHYWFMIGCAKKILLYCEQNLSVEWIPWIKGPLDTINSELVQKGLFKSEQERSRALSDFSILRNRTL